MIRLFPFLFLPLWLCAANPLYQDLPWIDGHDDEATLYAAPYLPENPVIIEAGVCDGEDTMKMKERWPNCTIYGFEALPEFYQRTKELTRNCKGVHLYNVALFDRVGKVTFYRSSRMPGASSVLEDNFDNVDIPDDLEGGENYKDKPIKVRCTTIDHWAKVHGVNHVDYLWLDTEGAELYILKKALTVLPTIRVISIEVNFKEFRKGGTQFPELRNFLADQNFTLKYIWGRDDWQGVALFLNNQVIHE